MHVMSRKIIIFAVQTIKGKQNNVKMQLWIKEQLLLVNKH